MSASSVLLHITDPHLLSVPGARLHGWDVAAAFDAVMAQALADHPDTAAIVLGGDLVDDESAAGYRWLHCRLARVGRPVLAIPGNHDDPAHMAEQLTGAVVTGLLGLDGWSIIGLDSQVRGQPHGRIGEAALACLDAELARHTGPCLLTVHHPPARVGSAWIDEIGLADSAALRDVVVGHPQVAGILAGHVHQAFEGTLAGRPVWTTPSTMRQFRAGSAQFAEDTQARPGYRCLRLHADGRIESRVHRLAR